MKPLGWSVFVCVVTICLLAGVLVWGVLARMDANSAQRQDQMACTTKALAQFDVAIGHRVDAINHPELLAAAQAEVTAATRRLEHIDIDCFGANQS